MRRSASGVRTWTPPGVRGSGRVSDCLCKGWRVSPQTGFDQPLLSAMYVNKRLSGVMAVQTLSRLNRMYRTPAGENKEKTFVLDFVNDPEEIREAFEPYHLDAHLETETDPMIVLKLAKKLEQAGVYNESDVDAAAETNAVAHA